MVSVNLKSLVAKLNPTCYRTLEAAAGLCLARTNYNVEIEHWLFKLLETDNTDLAVILRHYGVDTARLQRDLTTAIDRLKTGNARPPVLSPQVVELARDGWVIGSVDLGSSVTRSSHVLCAMYADESRSRMAREMSKEWAKISIESLMGQLPALTAQTCESAAPADAAPTAAAAADRDDGAVTPGKPSKTPALDQYTTDLTASARAGKIDPVLGRDEEIRQIVDILTRRRQNNPILAGEAGVGKTAIAEGLAQRIATGDVPTPLRQVVLRNLDLGLLQAGASVRGEFENRLKGVIDEVKASEQPIILFIDEAHMLIGAGGQAGHGDAANLLKPALARGELRTIAATTWAEYKKYFEKDPALSRRFQVVKVDEPSEAQAINMMHGLAGTLEKHHRVRILYEAVVESVRLSHRYICDRHLPDKSVSLLDTACARVALRQSATPPPVEDCRRRIRQGQVLIETLEREEAAGADHQAQLAEAIESKTSAEAKLDQLTQRWKQESELVHQIQGLRKQLESGMHGVGPGAPQDTHSAAEQDEPAGQPDQQRGALLPEQRQTFREKLTTLTAQLSELQGQEPLMSVCVDGQAIAAVVSSWTGIPVGRMVTDEIRSVLALKENMQKRIVGQDYALDAISHCIRTARANLTDQRRPLGVFLMVGPSGVGKTETALTLAELLYGGEQNLTVINMSEFKEEHKVSLLMGSPPGYVGYGEGGVLTEAVRRRPYSVVLLDEIEKAHRGVQDIFYQVFDKGTLRDGEGRDIDFKNTVIIMTSNAASDVIMAHCADPISAPEPSSLAEILHDQLQKTFKPAFLGRVTLVPYYPLADDVMHRIIELQLARVGRRIRDNHGADFSYSPELVTAIGSRCTEVESGARNVDHIITRTLLPAISTEILSHMADGDPITKVHVAVGNNGEFQYEVVSVPNNVRKPTVVVKRPQLGRARQPASKRT